jgi:hypothetical protein
MNSKTKFTTKGGQSTDVATIKAANAKTEEALFNLRYQLGIFAIYCEEKKLTVKEQAEKLAKVTGVKKSSIPVYCSEGKRLVQNKATFKGLQAFNRKAKTNNVKAGVSNYAKHVAGQKLAPATPAKDAPAKDAPAKVRTHDTHTVGKDAATRCTVSHPLQMTAEAKANFREVIEKACAASDISLESVFPELAKVKA